MVLRCADVFHRGRKDAPDPRPEPYNPDFAAWAHACGADGICAKYRSWRMSMDSFPQATPSRTSEIARDSSDLGQTPQQWRKA